MGMCGSATGLGRGMAMAVGAVVTDGAMPAIWAGEWGRVT